MADVGTQLAPPAAPKRRRMPPADRRQQIVDAAIAYFAEVGFDGGTRELAKRMGVTQPLIYRYFPSKEGLIRTVYREVYLNRWRPEWDALLSDRSLDLRDRLLDFYQQFTAVVFDSAWLRIYLFSGLRGLDINNWWLSFVEEHVVRRVCIEVRHSFGLPDPEAEPVRAEEIDLYWMYHSGIFYYGLRREWHNARPKLALPEYIAHSIDSLLIGFPQAVRRMLAG